MKTFISICIGLIGFEIAAQNANPDLIESSMGSIKIQPVLHGTVVLSIDNKTIFIDPYGGAEVLADYGDPDLILITDIHGDHLNQKTLDGLTLNQATFIVPQAVADKLPEKYSAEVLSNGGSTNWNDIEIEAIPMYNLPDDESSRHPKGRGNGYILNFGNKRFYISGDTEDIPEMRTLKNIDIAFVCMNLPYTMDVEQAASAVSEFKPAIVYPYHYRGQGGLSDVDKFKSLVNESAPEVDVRLRNWYPSN
jgi:L-ascorbate metabolism protein UlaG (beta-lactamase superfamily)